MERASLWGHVLLPAVQGGTHRVDLPAKAGACVAGEPWVGLCRAPGTHSRPGSLPPVPLPQGRPGTPAQHPYVVGPFNRNLSQLQALE